MKKLLKTIFKILLTFTLVGSSAVFLLIWKLHSEPMTLNKVTSYLLRNHPEVTVTQTQVIWKNITNDPKIEFKDISYTYKNSKLSAPKATLTINIWDLLFDEIHLKNLVIQNPYISLQTYPHRPTSSTIDKIEDIIVSYQNLLRTLPIDHFELLEGALELSGTNTPALLFSMIGQIESEKATLNLQATLEDMHISAQTFLDKESISYHLAIKNIDLSRNIPSAFLEEAFLPLNSPTKIDLKSKGKIFFEQHLQLQSSSSLNITLSPKDMAPIQVSVPLALSAVLKDKQLSYQIQTETSPIYLKDLSNIWPQDFSTAIRTWMLSSLTEGLIDKATLNISGIYNVSSQHHTLKNLDGSITMDHTAVEFMEGMPKIRESSAVAKFTDKSFEIDISSGSIKDMHIKKGKIVFTDIDKIDQNALIDLSIEAPLEQVLWLISLPKLDFLSVFDSPLSEYSGHLNLDLSLKFPLKTTLDPKEIIPKVRAQVSNAQLKTQLGEKPLWISKAQLDFLLDKDHIKIKGPLLLNKQKAHLDLLKNLSTHDTIYRLNLETTLPTYSQFLDLPLTHYIHIEGPFIMDLEYIQHTKNPSTLQATINLKNSYCSLPLLQWEKHKNIAGSFKISATFDPHLKKLEIPFCSLPNLKLIGTVHFGPKEWEKIDINSFEWHRNALTTTIEKQKDQTFLVSFNAPYLELSFDQIDHWENIPSAAPTSFNNYRIDGQIKDFNIQDVFIKDFSVNSITKNDILNSLTIQGSLEGQDTFHLNGSRLGNIQNISFDISNIQAFSKWFKEDKKFSSKNVSLKAMKDLSNADQGYTGTMQIKDLTLSNIPFVAKMLSIFAIDGATRLFQQGGFKLDHTEVNFHYGNKKLDILKAIFTNSGLGITTKGTLNFQDKHIDLYGVVIPAYLFNSILSYIPILGNFLSGGNQESGVFSADYTITGPFDNPTIHSNPLSAITPSFLKNIFGGRKFGDS